MTGLTEGRSVHYVLHSGPFRGQHRAAIVSYVEEQRTGRVTLHAFTKPDDMQKQPVTVEENVPFDDTDKRDGTWHWIEQA